MKIIYVAGAYRADSENGVFENIVAARAVAQKLWHKGWAVICPHMNTAFMGSNKHDTIFLDGDLEILSRCDAILMLPGWHESIGANMEYDLARLRNLIVYYDIAEVPDEMVSR